MCIRDRAYTYSHLYGIPTTGLRFFTVYGPYGRPDMAYFSFTQKMVRGETIKVFNNGDMKRDFTYVGDIVRGVTAMLDHPPQGEDPARVYNIGNNRPEDQMCIRDRCGTMKIRIESWKNPSILSE